MVETSTLVSRGPANTEESTRDLQDRLARFARLTLFVAAPMFVVARVLDMMKPEGLTVADVVAPSRVSHALAVVVLAFVWWRSRRGPLQKSTLELLDALVTVVVCTAWGMLGWGGGVGYPAALSMILAMTHTLVARSVVIPSSFRRTLWISAVSTLPTIVVMARYGASFVPNSSPQRARIFLVFAIMWCIAAAAIAALNSMALYGLRKQIREVGKLGQYTLEEKIGEGGMGVVHRATHAMLRRPAAIKLLLKDRASEKDLARFEREVQHTSRLAHPNTISIFDYGRTAEGVFYYVMEYLDGMDLDRLVEAEGAIPPARAIHILSQVTGALAEAHALGLIHRDIKPANIVLTERADEPDVVKVVDFGLVKTLDAAPGESTVANVIVGTPMYLAPEAITSPETIDGRADLYAVGAVAYYLVTGKHVFEAKTTMEMCGKHLMEKPVPPSERLGKPLPADLEAIVLACLAKERDARPRSASELRSSLLKCADATAYDVDDARAWWRNRGKTLRASKRPDASQIAAATTMAIDLRGRNGDAAKEA